MNSSLKFLIISEAVAVVVAAAVLGWHWWGHHHWDPETARLKAKGLPWMVLLLLTVPIIYCAACFVGGTLGHRAGVLALILLAVVVRYSRRVSATKRLRDVR